MNVIETTTGNTALHFACRRIMDSLIRSDMDCEGCVTRLINAGCDTSIRNNQGATAVDIATSGDQGRRLMARVMTPYGPNRRKQQPVKQQERVNTRLGSTMLLLHAAQNSDTSALASLLEDGADVNALVSLDVADPMRPGRTAQRAALFLAIAHKQDSAVRWLLDHGANPGTVTVH